jgi:thiosulfate/3-mercaptopyruvate sulfurtransferase
MASPIVSLQDLASLPNLVLLDARGSAEGYAAGHLRGAHHAHPDTTLSAARDAGSDPARGGRHPLPPLERWTKQLGAWGIGPSSNVVVYDDQSGANAAARAWWMLRSVGHERAFVLDGGLPADVELTTDVPVVTPLPPYPALAWLRPTVGIDDVERLRGDAAWRVLDVRSEPRFRGLTEPFDPIAGHIPGAVNLPFTANLEGGRFKSPDELRAQYTALLGDVRPEHLVVHCGSGITACHTLLALEAAGLEGASLYVGSWSEWCRDEERPREP